MKKLFFLILILAVVACSKSEMGIEDYTPPGNFLMLSFVDENGVDLLNYENPNALNRNTIKLYHLVEGKKKIISSGALTTYTSGIDFGVVNGHFR